MIKEKIIVGMSGGVDSSVSAYLLQQQGYHVEGLFMKNWEEDDTADYCSASQDIADAEAVCQTLGIYLHKVNFATEYWDNVFELFLDEYKKGRTPNPDIICNKEIKFKAFLDYAIHVLSCDKIAMGHYAGVDQQENGEMCLLRGKDNNKDQSYFLYTLSSDILKKSVFPLAELTKEKVREIAHHANLVTYNKKDSTGICFIGERRFKDFLSQYLPAQKGAIEDKNGERIGEHDGLMYYTIGQRKGLQIGGRKNSSGEPWYVIKKDLSRNVLIVAQGAEDSDLYATGCIIDDLHFVNGQLPKQDMRLSVKVRYRQKDVPCVIVRCQHDTQLKIMFDKPVSAVTEGQSAVLYDNEVCLGGGIIHSVIN